MGSTDKMKASLEYVEYEIYLGPDQRLIGRNEQYDDCNISDEELDTQIYKLKKATLLLMNWREHRMKEFTKMMGKELDNNHGYETT